MTEEEKGVLSALCVVHLALIHRREWLDPEAKEECLKRLAQCRKIIAKLPAEPDHHDARMGLTLKDMRS